MTDHNHMGSINAFFRNERWQNFRQMLLLASIIALIFTPITHRMMLLEHDYIEHTERATLLLQNPFTLTPHFLYQVLTIAVFKLTFTDMNVAGIIVSVAANVSSGLIIFWMLRDRLNVSFRFNCFITVSLLLVAPIPLIFPHDHHLYFGYIGINVLHNPTMVVLKPLSILLFCTIVRYISLETEKHWPLQLLILAIITILNILSKPSYVICLLPAIFIAMLIPAGKMKAKKVMFLFSGFILPSLTGLGFQYLITYYNLLPDLPRFYHDNSSIILAPLVFMRYYSDWLTPKFFLSVLFPMTVFICYPREGMNTLSLRLAWLTFAIGSFYTYFLAESGQRLHQGNFGWSGQITLFILFLASTIFASTKIFNYGKFIFSTRNILIGASFLLHTLSGLVLYLAEFCSPEKYW